MNKLLDLIFPENLYCAVCGDIMEQSRIHEICDSCVNKIEWCLDNPFRNQMDDFAFSDLMACCYYGAYARKLVTKMKLSGAAYISKGLGLLMAERFLLSGKNSDIVTAVPMYVEKKQARGFNQSELLAEYMSKDCGLKLISDLLIKTEPTPSLRLSDAETRKHALENIIICNPKYETQIIGSSILLIDDVVTTGSTADACARALISAGAGNVQVLCFAVNPNKKSG